MEQSEKCVTRYEKKQSEISDLQFFSVTFGDPRNNSNTFKRLPLKLAAALFENYTMLDNQCNITGPSKHVAKFL